MEQDAKRPVQGVGPDELDQVPEHVDDPVPEKVTAAAPVGGPLRFARMTGSSIASRGAAGWVTDFLNAAYYRRPVAEREVDDLRLAFSIFTTYWYRRETPPRLRLTDLRAFHRIYGKERFNTELSGRGRLTRDQLLEGAAGLLGDWFPAAYDDDARRAWGIAFPSVPERDAYDPERRLSLAKLGKLTPESAPPEQQTWHTYPPVEMPSVDGVVGALTRPETWPDYASEIGRFTPLRPGGLGGQTFEIEVAAGTESGLPIFTRGYITITRLATPDDPEALRDYFEELESGLARYGDDEPRAVPPGGQPVVGFDLTTHENHFMGAGHNRLILYTHEGRAWVRAAGTWDPMPWHVEQSYRRAGQTAQHAFWGQGGVARLSMLHQLALRIA
ncbi:MAG: hypothetical protein JO286_28215 [Solirubrobacterales bacterium]|nr:hypothetical protein [Solirubrobacterales bacterium]